LSVAKLVIYKDGKRVRLTKKGAPISLTDELTQLRREEANRLSVAEYQFSKVDAVCIAARKWER
jgi:hypothetical protein